MTQGASSTAAMESTKYTQNVLISVPEELIDFCYL